MVLENTSFTYTKTSQRLESTNHENAFVLSPRLPYLMTHKLQVRRLKCLWNENWTISGTLEKWRYLKTVIHYRLTACFSKTINFDGFATCSINGLQRLWTTRHLEIWRTNLQIVYQHAVNQLLDRKNVLHCAQCNIETLARFSVNSVPAQNNSLCSDKIKTSSWMISN